MFSDQDGLNYLFSLPIIFVSSYLISSATILLGLIVLHRFLHDKMLCFSVRKRVDAYVGTGKNMSIYDSKDQCSMDFYVERANYLFISSVLSCCDSVNTCHASFMNQNGAPFLFEKYLHNCITSLNTEVFMVKVSTQLYYLPCPFGLVISDMT